MMMAFPTKCLLVLLLGVSSWGASSARGQAGSAVGANGLSFPPDMLASMLAESVAAFGLLNFNSTSPLDFLEAATSSVTQTAQGCTYPKISTLEEQNENTMFLYPANKLEDPQAVNAAEEVKGNSANNALFEQPLKMLYEKYLLVGSWFKDELSNILDTENRK